MATADGNRATSRGRATTTVRRRATFGRRPAARLVRGAATIAALVAAGCGSTTFVGDLPPAAEPASSPPLEAQPAGRVVSVGNAPEGVAADPDTGLVAVGLREPDELALVDGRTGRTVRRVPLPAAPRHLQLAAVGGPVLVPAERADALVRVALPGGKVASVRVGAFPHDAAAAAGGRIFVSDERGNTVSVIEDDGRTRSIPVATQPGGVAAVAGGARVAVVSVRERLLELYDATSSGRLARVPAGVGPTHAVGGGEGRVYVVDTTGDALLVFETRPELKLTRRVALPGAPYGLAVDPVRGRLWTTLTRTNQVVELAAGRRPRVLRSFPTVRQPNTVAVDPRSGRVYVAGKADGVLQLLDPPALPGRRSR